MIQVISSITLTNANQNAIAQQILQRGFYELGLCTTIRLRTRVHPGHSEASPWVCGIKMNSSLEMDPKNRTDRIQ
jgi:hypothetical protein